MKREIKFRAKIMLSVANAGQWRYWKLFQEIPDSCVLDKDTLGQFTGLKDINGREIYEGDIIKSPKYDNSREVKYEDIEASDDMTAPGIGFQFNTEPGTMEVIGNIHN